MGKFIIAVLLLLGCGGVSDYSDAELLAAAEQQVSYQALRPNNEMVVSSGKRRASWSSPLQLALSPAEAVYLAGQLFAAVIYAPNSSPPTNNMLALYDRDGLMQGQTVLAQWRTHGNIFAITANPQASHMYAELFFLRAARSVRIGGYAHGRVVQSQELHVASAGRQLLLAYGGRSMDMVVSSKLHQEQVNLKAIVVNPSGDVIRYLQSKDVKPHKLNDQYSRISLPQLNCDAGDLVLVRLAGHNHVHESDCYLIK
ncbi:MAG: hypothetical protein OYH77_01285 [Pseudomonadota bacterium]|nr:hypothetical protein [Pseudomonadota bacterium]